MRNAVAALATMIALAPQAWSQLKIQTIVDAASYQPGLPTGGIASIFVSGLAGAPGLYTPSNALPLPYQLLGIEVFLGDAIPILAIYIPPDPKANAQINVQVPQRGVDAPLVVQQLLPFQIDTFTSILPSRSGSFFSQSSGYAAAQHASDYSIVTVQNPAHAGETIVVYANGLFRTWPPPPLGFPTPAQPLFTPMDPYPQGTGYLYLESLKTTVDPCPHTSPLNVTFEGLAPGLVGTEQINFVVPANQQSGDWYLFFSLAGNPVCSIGNPPAYTSQAVKLPVR